MSSCALKKNLPLLTVDLVRILFLPSIFPSFLSFFLPSVSVLFILYFRCNCTDNWSGPSCTDDVDECATLDSPCTLPNTRCTNTQGGYVCNCTEAWKGDSCTEDVDECEEGNITCHNNGTCVNNEGL